LLDNEDGAWEGNASELLAQLNIGSSTIGGGLTPQSWPKTARAMSGHLRRMAPALESKGITATFQEHGRIWTLSGRQEDTRGPDLRAGRRQNHDGDT
jgi:hypothetical protein